MKNKKEYKYFHRKALKEAIDFIGSISELARQLGTQPNHVGNWIYRDHFFPPQYASKVEKVTLGLVKKESLCPEIFD